MPYRYKIKITQTNDTVLASMIPDALTTQQQVNSFVHLFIYFTELIC